MRAEEADREEDELDPASARDLAMLDAVLAGEGGHQEYLDEVDRVGAGSLSGDPHRPPPDRNRTEHSELAARRSAPVYRQARSRQGVHPIRARVRPPHRRPRP